jgi:hypothetical protein
MSLAIEESIPSRARRCRIFITPHFYDPIATPGMRYSFTGAIMRRSSAKRANLENIAKVRAQLYR